MDSSARQRQGSGFDLNGSCQRHDEQARDLFPAGYTISKEIIVSHYRRNVAEHRDSLLKQADKTMEGNPIDDAQLDLMVWSILSALHLTREDSVVDLCCGNGLITKRISRHVARVIGIDVSPDLIEVARVSSRAENTEYIEGSVEEMDRRLVTESRKFYINEALQMLSDGQVVVLLKKLALAGSGVALFIGGIPDLERLWDYYDSDEKKSYFLLKESEGYPHQGKWRARADLLALGRDIGFEGTIIPQDPSSYTSHYRFDCLLTKL